jgi:hypothetical protein
MKPLEIFVLFILLLITTQAALAAMPPDHVEYQRTSATTYPDTTVGQVVNKYPEDFYACQIMTDSSIFYYFSAGFNSIGREYKATHSPGLCIKMVELAGGDQQKLSCAYGVCSHLETDTVYHNVMVESVIKATHLPNGIVHALAEEKMDKEILAKYPDLDALVRNSLRDKAMQHKDDFRAALIAEGSQLPFDSMYDAFLNTVVGDPAKASFQNFTAIPANIHVILILVLILNFVSMILLIKFRFFNVFGKVFIALNILIILGILGIYLLFFTNTLWQAFETLATPLGWFIPIPNEAVVRQMAQANNNALFTQGASHILTIADPSGAANLAAADASNTPYYLVFMLFMVLLIITLFILALKGGRKKNKGR